MEINEKDLKNTFSRLDEKMKGISENLNIGMEKAFPLLKTMAEEYESIKKPKDKKVVNIGGEDLFVSLLSNGKVVIEFHTLNGAEKYFNSL